MSNFEEFQMGYNWGWVTKAQLQQAVQQGQLTVEQYQEITGSPYPQLTPEKQESAATPSTDTLVFPRG